MQRRFKLILDEVRKIKYLMVADLSKRRYKDLFDCPVCDGRDVQMQPVSAYYLAQWQEHQTIHNPFFLETMNLAHYLCADCLSADRDRLYALYLEKYLQGRTQTSLLDIAPAQALANFIKSRTGVSYRSMDLMMENVDDHFDITNMRGYQDGQFDFFICSHVLEHIPDDIKAMQELYRVTKTGGKGIVMVPINLQLEETIEDPHCTDTAYRWKHFFQDDHVRMYAKDNFIHRLSSAGFTVQQLGISYFGEQVFKQYAIHPTSVLYVVNK